MIKNNSNKSGQVTIFVIAGIIIIGTLMLFLAYKNNSFNIQKLTSSDEEKLVQKYLDSCLETVSKDAIIKVFSQGGYYMYNPDAHIIINDELVPTYEIIPDPETINGEISLGIALEYTDCIDLTAFEDRGIILNDTGAYYSPEARLTKDNVITEIDYEITGTYNGKTFILTKSTYKSEPRLNDILFNGIEINKKFKQSNGQSLKDELELRQENKFLKTYSMTLESDIYEIITVEDKELNLFYTLAVKRTV